MSRIKSRYDKEKRKLEMYFFTDEDFEDFKFFVNTYGDLYDKIQRRAVKQVNEYLKNIEIEIDE